MHQEIITQDDPIIATFKDLQMKVLGVATHRELKIRLASPCHCKSGKKLKNCCIAKINKSIVDIMEPVIPRTHDEYPNDIPCPDCGYLGNPCKCGYSIRPI